MRIRRCSARRQEKAAGRWRARHRVRQHSDRSNHWPADGGFRFRPAAGARQSSTGSRSVGRGLGKLALGGAPQSRGSGAEFSPEAPNAATHAAEQSCARLATGICPAGRRSSPPATLQICSWTAASSAGLRTTDRACSRGGDAVLMDRTTGAGWPLSSTTGLWIRAWTRDGEHRVHGTSSRSGRWQQADQAQASPATATSQLRPGSQEETH